MTTKNYFVIVFAIILFSCTGNKEISEKALYSKLDTQKFENDWTSLRKHETPQWLIDAKFGIYCHWGIQTLQYDPEYSELSNDERIALFKGENFNADNWAKLFETAGAKFGGVIGWHGSDFKHWDSDISDYNSAKMGPKIDIVGEVFKAVKKRGMKTLVSYHSIKGDQWIEFAKEGVDKYDPDIFWVDASFGGTKGGNHKKILKNSKYIGQSSEPSQVFEEKYQREFIQYFYNNAINKGKEVEFMYKSYDIPPGVAMRDLENGLLDETAYDVWITDMDMNVPPDWETHGWFYRKGIRIRTANEVVDMMMDVISKNGIYLLNIPPMADGTFPEEVKNNLTAVGDWLNRNGEAVYGTSPWFIYGEGPNEIADGNYKYHHNNHFAKIQYGTKDIRFTTKGDNLFATCLGKPEGDLKIGALNSDFKLRKGDILAITHLGSGQKVEWNHNEEALEIKLENIQLDEAANAFKIELKF
ncbi:MAG: alpha-L-fucosidase [Reichenbachiella sp.]